ncbi:MAG TPA: hypothetical protein VGN12_15525 [Pirellulales bacterium]|jgi:membrane protease YdiL (CAAX protease family)
MSPKQSATYGVPVVDGQYQISLVQFSVTALRAAAAALVRTRSGSLLWPIIYHGTWDGTIFLVTMLR